MHIRSGYLSMRSGNGMETIQIKHLESITELQALMRVFASAFETEYVAGDAYLTEMIVNPAGVYLGALSGKALVGGLVAFLMTPIHGTKELYIYDIAVLPVYQKQGIGRLLIEQVKQVAKEHGVGTIFVEAEADDPGAVAFYRVLGGEEVAVNHFNFSVSPENA